MDLSRAEWRKSTLSQGGGNNCVEVATLPGGGRVVRDPKDIGGPVPAFAPDSWRAFIGGVKDGVFG
ncbi:DUF397 domain-containing protein [Streptosporangium sandarakinum]|uniref:DUF397 domain-containing protein n=1 Tax=Streptosporangium sandarakinum TaxID=1260955 RepID=UPI00344258A8